MLYDFKMQFKWVFNVFLNVNDEKRFFLFKLYITYSKGEKNPIKKHEFALFKLHPLH